MSRDLIFDDKPFFALVRDLQEISGKTFEELLVDQVAALMKVCIRLTHAPKTEKLTKRILFRNRGLSIKSGSKIYKTKDELHDWFRNADGKAFYDILNWRVPDPIWKKALVMKQARQDDHLDPQIAPKSRGSAKSTWYNIANSLGIGDKTGAPGYVKNAQKFMGGVLPDRGFAKRLMDAAALYIEIRNESRALVKGASKHFRGRRESLDGYKILQSAILQRRAAFNRDLEKGVFDDIELRAIRYPGVFVK